MYLGWSVLLKNQLYKGISLWLYFNHISPSEVLVDGFLGTDILSCVLHANIFPPSLPSQMHIEAAKMLSLTEEEFVKALDWGAP